MPHTLCHHLDTLHRSMYGEPLPHDLHAWDHWQQALAYLARQKGPQDGGAPSWFADQRVPCGNPDCPNLTTDTYCAQTCLAGGYL